MTCEIAILNKEAVVLAADSASSLVDESGTLRKVFTTSTKIYNLGEEHSVGIMSYGSAEFMSIPWDVIISLFCDYISSPEKQINRLEEYADEFINFLENDTIIKNKEEEYLEQSIIHYINKIIEIIIESEEAEKEESGIEEFTPTKLDELWQSTLQSETKSLKNNILVEFKDRTNDLFRKKVNKAVDNALKKMIKNCKDYDYDPDKNRYLEQLQSYDSDTKKIIELIIYSEDILGSGIVIAGFGKEEIFPSLVSFEIGACYYGILKYKNGEKEIIGKIEKDKLSPKCAAIIPFAQKDVIETFLNGIDSEGHDNLVKEAGSLTESNFLEVLKDKRKVEEFLLSSIGPGPLQEDVLKSCIKSLNKFKNSVKTLNNSEIKHIVFSIIKTYRNWIEFLIDEEYKSKIITSITYIPKEELVLLAENLINMTSIKRKISSDIETVGGPTDVIVISKTDGFKWIKRKKYYEPELND